MLPHEFFSKDEIEEIVANLRPILQLIKRTEGRGQFLPDGSYVYKFPTTPTIPEIEILHYTWRLRGRDYHDVLTRHRIENLTFSDGSKWRWGFETEDLRLFRKALLEHRNQKLIEKERQEKYQRYLESPEGKMKIEESRLRKEIRDREREKLLEKSKSEKPWLYEILKPFAMRYLKRLIRFADVIEKYSGLSMEEVKGLTYQTKELRDEYEFLLDTSIQIQKNRNEAYAHKMWKAMEEIALKFGVSAEMIDLFADDYRKRRQQERMFERFKELLEEFEYEEAKRLAELEYPGQTEVSCLTKPNEKS